MYSIYQDELKVSKKYLEKNLSKGFIRASSSFAASPLLFARKLEDGLQFSVDYRQLNVMTIKNQYLLPLLKKTLEHICKARIYSKEKYYSHIQLLIHAIERGIENWFPNPV